jgi:hypothetical protein
MFNAIPTLRPERKHYLALNNASVRMAPEGSEYEGWLDLGDAVAIAYSPSVGYAGAANPNDSARKLIDKVRGDTPSSIEPLPTSHLRTSFIGSTSPLRVLRSIPL